MVDLLRRIAREWLVVIELLGFSVFSAFDGAGVVQQITGRETPEKWLYLAAFVILGGTFLARLVQLHTRIDDRLAVQKVAHGLGIQCTKGLALLMIIDSEPADAAQPRVDAWMEGVVDAFADLPASAGTAFALRLRKNLDRYIKPEGLTREEGMKQALRYAVLEQVEVVNDIAAKVLAGQMPLVDPAVWPKGKS